MNFKQALLPTSILLLHLIVNSDGLFDPFTVASIVGATAFSGLLGGGLYVLKCKFSECCEKGYGWVTGDFDGLENDIDSILYGQHLVKDTVLRSIKSHWRNESPQKALVMSFHGPTGTGKNYVTGLIAKRLYRQGMNSHFVKQWIGKLDFPHENEKYVYAKTIQKTIESVVASCARTLFIIDEIDVVSPGVIDALKPYLDYYDNIKGVDYKKAIFIFLSNTGSNNISNLVFEKLEMGEKREDITLKDFQIYIENGAFNEKGGLQKSTVIKNSLIDVFVPFLPLEKQHVIECVIDILHKKKCFGIPMDKVKAIAEQLTYAPPGFEYFSRSGCKQLETIVALNLEDSCVPKIV